MSGIHPDLAFVAHFLPRAAVGPRSLKIVRLVPAPTSAPKAPSGLSTSVRPIPGALTARLFQPENAAGPVPAMLWIHGGGFIIGSPAQDDARNAALARELGMVIVAPSYRLAPEHPYPAAMDDLYATLRWMHDNAPSLRIRTDRIVIGGASAGGGLAAGLTLLARDRGEIPVFFQLLVYPMLDDRTVGRVIDGRNHRLWNAASNHFGWTSYLGHEPDGRDVPVYASPARSLSLAGLPLTWIGVGDCDLFHDEDVDYARRLEATGVPVQIEIVPGAFHGFDVFRRAPIAQAFFASQVSALRRAFA